MNSNSTLNVLEAEELLRLCRAGRLYDIEKWIAAGRSFAMPSGMRNTPLGVAINNGFHSLAELLARHETQQQKDHMRLLLKHGALWRPDDARAINDVRRDLLDCYAEVTLEVISALVKHNACGREAIEALLKTPTIKAHVAEIRRKLGLLGFDVRTREQIAVEARQTIAAQEYSIRTLMARYPREKLYEDAWSEPMLKVAKRYGVSDVMLTRVCKKLNIPKPGRGYWEKKAAGKPVPKRPALPPINFN